MEQTGGKGDHDSRLVRDLCTLLVTIIFPVAAASSVDSPRRPVARRPRGGMSPAGAASMLLGASMALMLCGSVTFAIGFLLMPWVAGVALLFGFAGVISTLSSGLLPSSSPSSSKDKEQRLLMATQGLVRASAPPMSSVPDKLVAWR